ncbi:MAG TPA: hypothetical protein VEW90_00320 [Gaiellaceae bacterium]|nr:hypothetical protein [Gaiellaceae bacterium]
MRARLVLLALAGIATIALASVAQGKPSPQTDMDRTKAAGWDCNPEVPIAGDYLHCAPPGKPSVAELASAEGITDASLSLRVFNLADESFAGIESLIRADLYKDRVDRDDRQCRQDAQNLPNGEWGLLVLPGQDYRACHRFERTST